MSFEGHKEEIKDLINDDYMKRCVLQFLNWIPSSGKKRVLNLGNARKCIQRERERENDQ